MLEVNKKNFGKEVLESDKPVIVDFWASWCSPCLAFAPTFEKIAEELKDYKFAKCNIDENQELAQEQGIMSIPCIVFYKKGKEAGRAVGNLTEEAFKDQIKSVLG